MIRELALLAAGLGLAACMLLAIYTAYTGEAPGRWFQWAGNTAVAIFLLASAVAVLA